MKKIYLVLTQTGTIISKLIAKHTGNTYNHISLALSPDLKQMYSFGRLNPYVFFVGGFVIESPRQGTYKRFGRTTSKVLALEVSDASFGIIRACINAFVRDKRRFGYNFLGILKAKRNVFYQTTFRKFYCSQFVDYLLVCAHIIREHRFGAISKPEDFCSLPDINVVYEGLLNEYDQAMPSAAM